MSIRSVVPLSLMLLAAALSSASPAAAQAPASRQERALARQWATVRADSAAVDRLFQATVRTGGPVLFGAVLDAARDAGRPGLVRVYALAALYAYARPLWWDSARSFLWAARDAGIVCEPSRAWAPGDTLHACARTFTISEPPRVRFAAGPALAADSARVDTIVAAARAIARGGRSPVAGAADMLLSKLNVPRSPRLASTAACPGASATALAPGDTIVVDRVRVYEVAEVTSPPTLQNGCTIARLFSRNYPPLARDAREEGTLVLSLVVEPDGNVRTASVERAAPRPDFEEAALRVAERFRFTPARLGAARVAVRVSVPVRFAFGSEYPRVPDP
jgi:TonB family protein